MYSPRIIQQKLDNFSRDNGWEPTYHSIEQIREFKEYIGKITKSDANSRNITISITKRLTEDRLKQVKRWVENEQILCTIDSNYFETRYGFICDEKGDIFQFRNRKSQEVFDSVVAHFEELEVAIELFVLKARQLGISTKTALKFIHRLLFIGHTQAVMSSVQADKSELIARILNICYQNCPWWLVPQLTASRAGKMMEWNNGSVLSIQSGSQATGIAQGWTPTNIHISEIGDIPNPKKVLEEGLLRATHPSRKLFQVWEGTGNGNTGYQADMWRALKEDFPRGRARFCPIFIPWPLATDLYPEADWVRKFPIPESWHPTEETRKHVTRCELYIRNTDYLAKICGVNYKMPREQQWFWEFNYLAAVKSKTQKIWMSQMPADDYEALTGKNDTVFDQEVIEVREKDRDRKYKIYGIVGNAIDDGLSIPEDQIDYEDERIALHWESHRGMKYDWMLIPLLPFDEHDERNSFDKLIVFEEPKENRDYSIGIDTADGLGKEDEDRCVISVAQSAKGNNPDVQVAEFVSIRINSPQTVGFAAAIATWYGAATGDPRGVKFCIEQRERPGDDCQLQLKLMGFTWHHRMIRYDKKDIHESKSTQEGWMTNVWSRPFIMNRFVDAIKNGWYKPNSQYLIREMGNFERRFTASGKTRLEHQSGKHDDRIWAASLSYITRHHVDILQDRSTKVYTVRGDKKPDIDLSYASMSSMSVGD